MKIVAIKEDMDDTARALYEDRKFLKDLGVNCDTKSKKWDERVKTRTAELLALADTIKILNDDDALELFKKTLPSPSLMQTNAGAQVLKQRALLALGAVKSKRAGQ